MRLSAETVEIDINDIPENREVQVGINLDNNPGMQGLAFCIRKDSRLSCDEIRLFEFDRDKRGLTHGFYDNGNVIETSVLPVLNVSIQFAKKLKILPLPPLPVTAKLQNLILIMIIAPDVVLHVQMTISAIQVFAHQYQALATSSL